MDRAAIPETMGLQSSLRANVGEAKSRGFDMSLDYNHSINKDLWITGRANFTYATSEFLVYEKSRIIVVRLGNHVSVIRWLKDMVILLNAYSLMKKISGTLRFSLAIIWLEILNIKI